METAEVSPKAISDFNLGYENGYHRKDYTWEDGIKFISIIRSPESDDYKKGYAKGQRDRLRDEMQRWMF